jgi:cobalamin biosynthesis Co2+ chelatase CbiK
VIEIQQAQFWIGVIALFCSGIVATSIAVYRIMSKIDDDRDKQDIKIEATRRDALDKADVVRATVEEKLTDKVRERNEKIDGVGKSLDKFKEEAYKNFVLEKVCCQMHLHTREEILRIEEAHKSSRHELLNLIQKINLTLESYGDKFSELKELILKR